MPSEIALLQHLKSLKPKLLAEIDLICANLRDAQTPKLFLKKGDVFGGNRALRAIGQKKRVQDHSRSGGPISEHAGGAFGR